MTPAERWFGVPHEARAQHGLRPLARIVATTGPSALFQRSWVSDLGTPALQAMQRAGPRLGDPIGTQAPEGNLEAWLRPTAGSD